MSLLFLAQSPFVAMLVLVVGFLLLIGAFIFVIMLISYGRLWIQALSSGVSISIFSLFGMWLRKVSASVIVNAMIMAHKAKVEISRDLLESHYLAGGNVPVLVHALVLSLIHI
ncbi:MAG: flotillin-like FloA family protein, partial [Planctomycetota bacterium]|nr:flotillin-like FloA family protein [Planctomycetota bacterium]